MRIISKRTLKRFYEQVVYKDSKESLESWHKEVSKADWDNSNQLKLHYANASIVGNNIVVFNIHGNKYRLIVKINYHAKVIYIKFVGTHKEYDKINVTEI